MLYITYVPFTHTTGVGGYYTLPATLLPSLSPSLIAFATHNVNVLTYSVPAAPAKRILSLRDPTQKMSKSAPHQASRILLTDPTEVIEKKIRSAVTDSERGVTYNPIERPGVANLLTILDACERIGSHGSMESESENIVGNEARDDGQTSDTRLEALAARFATVSHAELKRSVTEAVEATIAPIRSEYTRVRADESYLRDVAEAGRTRAAEAAEETMWTVREILGVGRF